MVDRLMAGMTPLLQHCVEVIDGAFNILDHWDALEPDGGRTIRGDHSFKCPACGADNFKVNISDGKWNNWNCDCSKAQIREAISPATAISYKQIRTKQSRSWDTTPVTLERNEPA